jgi:hypothetical protein
MNAPTPPDKFRRYRDRQKARGLKEVRRWVYDLDAPGVREKLAAEIARINASPDNQEVLDFIEAAADFSGWVWDGPLGEKAEDETAPGKPI